MATAATAAAAAAGLPGASSESSEINSSRRGARELPPELALVQDSSLGAFDEVVAMLRGSGASLDGEDAAATAATGVPNDDAAAAAAAAAYSLKEQPFDFDKRDQISWLGFTRYRRLATL